MKKTLLALVFLLTGQTYATTWDEPWMDQVIKEADSFVLARIRSADEEKGLTIFILQQFGGEKIEGKIKVNGFYLLDIGSTSGGHGPEFHFEGVDSAYFFLKKNKEGDFSLATPTTGFATFMDGKVRATYRHSYHQALVPRADYESTMTAIYNHYHGLEYDRKGIQQFVETQLSQKPAGFDKHEIATFFIQHAALESIYHLRLDGLYDKILPFFNDETNFHNRVSAARALIAYNTENTKRLLLEKITANKDDDFTTVICIWTLASFHPVELKSDLQKLLETASTEDNGFGGNIMDPRVGTHFPDVKRALEELIETL